MSEIGAKLDNLERRIRDLDDTIKRLIRQLEITNERLAVIMPLLTPPKPETAEEPPPTKKFPDNARGYLHGRE